MTPLGIFDGLFQDPVFLALLVALLGFVFFLYLFVRRTITGFQEGVERGQR
jgi:F0F1-type ATP synthase membrane subunit b/b'